MAQWNTRSGRGTGGAYIARVSYTAQGDFGVLWDSELRRPALAAPPGLRALPREGDRLLMLPGEGGAVCAGVIVDPAGLTPGVLELTGLRGSFLRFEANGDIVLNGVTVTREGDIIPKGEA